MTAITTPTPVDRVRDELSRAGLELDSLIRLLAMASSYSYDDPDRAEHVDNVVDLVRAHLERVRMDLHATAGLLP